MALPAVHQLRKVESLLGGSVDASALADQQIRPHHATVEPVDGAAALDAADHPDIRSVYFGDHFADQVFRQPVGIWQIGRRIFDDAHGFYLPPHEAREHSSTNVWNRTEQFRYPVEVLISRVSNMELPV